MVIDVLARWLRRVGASGTRRLRAVCSRRSVRIAGPILAVLLVLPPATLVQHVYFDRNGLPELGPFLQFQPPTTGEIRDARGEVVVQLARQYRRVVTYDEVPLVVRQAVLAAEDENFLSHSGVDYGALKLEEVRLAVWLEEAMRKQYGTREQAKREILARYASFIYMGNGRYGFVAASEYYFQKRLAGYIAEDAGRAALLAGIGESPREFAPVAWAWTRCSRPAVTSAFHAAAPVHEQALGASEVRLLELAGAYRAMASGLRAEPHVIARVSNSAGGLLYEAPGRGDEISPASLALVQLRPHL